MTTSEFMIGRSLDDVADRKDEARKIFWALLAAVFIHLLIGYSLATFSGVFSSAVPVEEKPMELTIVDLATQPAAAPKNSMFVETDESKQSAEPPKEKTFESNANSIAASQVPPTGEASLPSQEGKDRPWADLETHAYSLANEGARPQPSAPPQQTPQPSQAPQSTPISDAEQFALLTAKPTPAPAVQASVAPTPAQVRSAYRPLEQQTRIRGNISNRGISSVNALGTPLGRYQKFLFDAIGSRWYASVEKHLDLFSIGTTRIVFRVDRVGHIQNLKVIGNTANELFANFCIQSVQEAQVPPMSDDLAATLPPEGLEVEIPFTLYAN